MDKYIHIAKTDRAFIAKAFGVTERYVWYALRFDEKHCNADKAKKIRSIAFERGGILMATSPVMEMFHDYDKVMHQYYPNGAHVELDRKNGKGAVIYKGRRVKTYENVALTDIDGIQEFAAALR